MKATTREIEVINMMLSGLTPTRVTIGEAGIELTTFTGAKHLDRSLGWVFNHNGRSAKEDVVRYALITNGLSDGDIDFIFTKVDLNWEDSSLVEDMRIACGASFTRKLYNPEATTFTSLRRK